MKPLRLGFSLVELMVVVVVAPSVLAGMLLPALSKARASAKRASCMSNQRQMGLGVMMFAADYDNWLPTELPGNKVDERPGLGDRDSDEPLFSFDPDAAAIAFFGEEIVDAEQTLDANLAFFNRLRAAGYLGEGYELFICPGSREPRFEMARRELFTPVKPVSYGVNFRAVHKSAFVSRSILLGDGARGRDPTPITDEPFARPRRQDNPASGVNHDGDGFNFVFLDGHARTVPGAPAGESRLALDWASTGPEKSVLHSVGNGRANDGAALDPQNSEDIAVY